MMGIRRTSSGKDVVLAAGPRQSTGVQRAAPIPTTRAVWTALALAILVVCAGCSSSNPTSAQSLTTTDHQDRSTAAAALPRSPSQPGTRTAIPAHSAITHVVIPTDGAQHAQTALVYLPAAYFDPAQRTRHFPVVELFDGADTTPQDWLTRLHLQQTADTEIAAGRATPFIAVMPTQNYLGHDHDGECVNAVHGAQQDTTLSTDVRAVMLRAFRAERTRKAWALMGFSTGGYCALNLAMRHPDWYSTVVDEAGDTTPYLDVTTGALFAGRTALFRANSPLWQVREGHDPDLHVLMIAGDRDRRALRQYDQFLPLAHSPMQMWDMFVHVEGHGYRAFLRFEPAAFDWLSSQFHPTPLSRARSVLGARPTPYHPGQTLPTPAPVTTKR
jgi:S-formylglutathione hydrolase FrmB